jgi:hypothetical protein
MVARATQDSLDLGWSEEPLVDSVESSEPPAVPLDNSDDDEPTRVATLAAAVVPAARADVDMASALRVDSAALDVPDAVIEALDPSVIEALDVPDAVIEALDPSVIEALDVPDAVIEALDASDVHDVSDIQDASDIHEEGARLTEPGLAPPPLTSAEIAAAELAAAVRTPVVAPERALVESRVVNRARTAPPIVNPPPVELGRAGPALEPAGAAPAKPSSPATSSQSAAAIPAASIPPPPIAPGFFTPASLAPTAVDWTEFASPSLFATMKRTRPTSAWTGVGLSIAALTFASGIGIGRKLSPPALPPVPVPAPLPASVAAGSVSPTATPAVTTELPAAPAAPPKQLAPFDAKGARAALDDAANSAKTCRMTGDPKGTIPTTVTFGPSGKVSNVAINSSRYAGTKTASCVAERLTEARVPEFSGFPEALKKLVTVR